MRSNNCRLFNFPPKKFDATSDGVFRNALLHIFDVSRSPACTSTWSQDGGSSQPTQKNVDECQKSSLTASKKSVEVRLTSIKLSKIEVNWSIDARSLKIARRASFGAMVRRDSKKYKPISLCLALASFIFLLRQCCLTLAILHAT